jgi:hypothetical protein
MAGRENDVIGGVNSFLDEQKKLPDPASISLVRFDTEATERFRPMQALAECKPLTAADYKPRGGTPLLDAIGTTVTQLDDDWKSEQPERAIVVIVTDGEENASHEYTKTKIQEMVKARQDSGKWAFIYLGANVDAFAEAGTMGIPGANTAGYVNSTRGIMQMYAKASGTVGVMRASGQTVAQDLGGNIGEDGTLTLAGQKEAVPAATQPLREPKPTQAWTPPN